MREAYNYPIPVPPLDQDIAFNPLRLLQWWRAVLRWEYKEASREWWTDIGGEG
jgi:hypothetical protein